LAIRSVIVQGKAAVSCSSDEGDATNNNIQTEIGNLPAAEKFELLDTLWESIEADIPALTDEQRAGGGTLEAAICQQHISRVFEGNSPSPLEPLDPAPRDEQDITSRAKEPNRPPPGGGDMSGAI
jgi:hypothetical protein